MDMLNQLMHAEYIAIGQSLMPVKDVINQAVMQELKAAFPDGKIEFTGDRPLLADAMAEILVTFPIEGGSILEFTLKDVLQAHPDGSIFIVHCYRPAGTRVLFRLLQSQKPVIEWPRKGLSTREELTLTGLRRQLAEQKILANSLPSRFSMMIFRLCGETPPMPLVQSWLAQEDLRLQDWVSNRDLPPWLQAIDVLELSQSAAELNPEVKG